MKILLLADEESKYLYDFFDKSKLEGIDLIISCGDLSPNYLSFLATFSSVPILYVHGNHDVCYKDTPPGGCTCIDGKLYEYKGIRILGLGGSMEYKYGGADHQYSERAMRKRIRRLLPKIKWKKGFDILVTHSPAYRINDSDDIPHTGFKCLWKSISRSTLHTVMSISIMAEILCGSPSIRTRPSSMPMRDIS